MEMDRPASPRQDSLLEIVWRRRMFVVATTAATLFLGLIYCIIATPKYTATSRLFVEPAGADAKASRDSSDRAAFLFTQREVVSSTPVLAMALGEPGILDLKTFEGQSSPFEYLHNTLSVDVGKKDELITVSFDSPHRDEATQVVAAVVEAYSHFQSSQRTASATGTTATLKVAKEKTEAEIAAKSKELQDFAIEHNVVGSDDQRRQLDAQSVNSIAASITSAHMDTLAAKARVDEAKRLGGPTTEPEADAPTIADAHVSVEDDQVVLRQLRDATLALQNLKRQLSPSHPVRMQMQQRVDQLGSLHRSILAAAYDAAVQREKDLREFYATEQRRTIEQNTYAAEYARRSAELARLQTLSDSMDTRVRELNVGDVGGMASVMVLEQAHADTKASSPQKMRALALAAVLGLVLGCVGACVSDRLDTRLKSATEVEQHIGLQAVGIIPTMPLDRSPVSRALGVLKEPESAFATAYRTLRNAVLLGGTNSRVKTILVTSPTRGDGRTTVSSNLAISLALAGQKVLLIDADLRAPAQDCIFDVENTRGLIDLLAPQVFDPAALDAVVQGTFVPNLHVLPSGARDIDAPELFNGKALTDLLNHLCQQYDRIIIDTPPSRAHTDARIVAASCDVTLLVLRPGKHDRNMVARTRMDLSNVGAHVGGVVLNHVPAAANISTWTDRQPKSGAMPLPPASGPRNGAMGVTHAAQLSPPVA